MRDSCTFCGYDAVSTVQVNGSGGYVHTCGAAACERELDQLLSEEARPGSLDSHEERFEDDF